MPDPLLIIITGPPCTGKTTLGRALSQELGFPFISKDDIKETLFETLGWKDVAWSHRLSLATYEILFKITAQLLNAGQSLLLEGTFKGQEHSDRFASLQGRVQCELVQVQCGAEGDVLVQRFLARWESGTRHPGHVDPQLFPEIQPTLQKGCYDPLSIPGPIYRLDATDFTAPAWQEAVARLKLVLAAASRTAVEEK